MIAYAYVAGVSARMGAWNELKCSLGPSVVPQFVPRFVRGRKEMNVYVYGRECMKT